MQIQQQANSRQDGGSEADVHAELERLRAESAQLKERNKALKRDAAPALEVKQAVSYVRQEVSLKRRRMKDLQAKLAKYDEMMAKLRSVLEDGPI